MTGKTYTATTHLQPTTLSYQALQSDKNELMVTIFERYVSKDAYLRIHKESVEFKRFRPILANMQEKGQVVVSGESYLDDEDGSSERGFFCR